MIFPLEVGSIARNICGGENKRKDETEAIILDAVIESRTTEPISRTLGLSEGLEERGFFLDQH